MTTFTVQVKDSDADMVLSILKKFKAKVIETQKESDLTEEIATALQQSKQIQEGKIQSLSLINI